MSESMGGPSRRTLLLGTSAAVGVSAVAALGVAGVASSLPPASRAPRRPLRALKPEAFAILAAVADRLCPGGHGLPSAWELNVPEAIDELLDRKHPSDTVELEQGLHALENPVLGALLDQRFSRFTTASPDQQERALEAWRDSRLPDRQRAFRALSGLVSSAYWGHPDTHAHVGYPGPPRFPT